MELDIYYDDTGSVDSIDVDTEDDDGRGEDSGNRDNSVASYSSGDVAEGHPENALSSDQFDGEENLLCSPQPPIPSTSDAAPPSQKTLHSFFQPPTQQPQRHFPIREPPPSQPLKRRATPTPPVSSKRPRQHGTSKSAQFEAKSRAAADKGTYDPLRFEKFKAKIVDVDPRAEFLIDGNPRIIRHSKCAGVIHMKATNNTTCFFQHLERCKGPTKKRAPTANVDKGCLARFLNRQTSTPAPPTTHVAPPSYPALPCPGLTPEHDE